MKWMLFAMAALLPVNALAKTAAISVDVLLSRLDAAEQEYHDAVFDYVMEAIKPDEVYKWQSYGASGQFKPGKKEAANNTVCRAFHEELHLKTGEKASFDGMGCKRVGSDGWCRLKKGELRSCALEPPRTMLDRAQQQAEDLFFEGEEYTRRGKRAWWQFWYDW